MTQRVVLAAAILVTTALTSACTTSALPSAVALDSGPTAASQRVVADAIVQGGAAEDRTSYTIYDVAMVCLTLYKREGETYKQIGYTVIDGKHLKEAFNLKDLSFDTQYKVTAVAKDDDGRIISKDDESNTVYFSTEKQEAAHGGFQAQNNLILDTLKLRLKDVSEQDNDAGPSPCSK